MPNGASTPSRNGNWSNRIVGHGEIDPNDLLANPRNWRIHPRIQQDALSGILADVGWVDEIIVNQRTGFVVDGHLRVSLALREEQSVVPVKFVDLTEEEEMLILATLDPIAGMAATDVEKMQELMGELGEQDLAVQLMLDRLVGKEQDVDYEGMMEGMPDFENEDAFGAVLSIRVHFASEEDVRDFAERLGQTVTMQTKYLWHPKSKREGIKGYST